MLQFLSTNRDELVKSQKAPVIVIPVKLVLDYNRGTGIQENQSLRGGIDGPGEFLRDHQL